MHLHVRASCASANAFGGLNKALLCKVCFAKAKSLTNLTKQSFVQDFNAPKVQNKSEVRRFVSMHLHLRASRASASQTFQGLFVQSSDTKFLRFVMHLQVQILNKALLCKICFAKAKSLTNLTKQSFVQDLFKSEVRRFVSASARAK